ncbi:MAG: hypothetical protein K8R88_12040 [Armatimonadetes bacterium]|nr:hypothetical protein [Armatimonadota bacterium]
MRKLLLVSLLGSCALIGAAVPPDNLKSELTKQYAKWNTLTGKADLKGLAAMLHPNFQYIDSELKVSRKAPFIKYLSVLFPQTRKSKNLATIENLTGSKEGGVTVWTTYNVSMEFKQREKWTPMKYSVKTKDSWVWKKGTWLLLKSAALNASKP